MGIGNGFELQFVFGGEKDEDGVDNHPPDVTVLLVGGGVTLSQDHEITREFGLDSEDSSSYTFTVGVHLNLGK